MPRVNSRRAPSVARSRRARLCDAGRGGAQPTRTARRAKKRGGWGARSGCSAEAVRGRSAGAAGGESEKENATHFRMHSSKKP